ncbi:MAG: hypothetical protein HYW71_03020 [Candidatus Niyogibacteria bacterium]|nr:hypothetical protein [Candidatus Niyogibacteria bacterium]
MILFSHILVASSATAWAVQTFGSKSVLTVFGVALASHYLLDAIPHWEYQLFSVVDSEDEKNNFSEIKMVSGGKNLLKDFFMISFDFFAGFAAAWFLTRIFWPDFSFWFLALAAGAGVLPDILQGFYIASKGIMKKIFFPLYIFHNFFHAQYRLKKYPLAGFLFQALIVGFIIALFYYYT